MLRKLEAKNMKIVWNHPYFKLIRVSDEDKINLKPFIMINGQMEHHIQAIETATKITYPWCYQYCSYYEYDDTIHTPYIFLYDYKIYGINRKNITIEAFATGLEEALESLKLENVDIIGESTGAMIGAMVTQSKRVDKVIALHAPIYGSVGLQSERYNQFIQDMELKEKAVIFALKLLIDEQFGYMQTNKNGFENIQKVVDVSKVLFTTSNILETKSKNALGNYLAELIYKYFELASDGMITFDKERMDKDGLTYEIEEGISHFDMGLRYTGQYYKRLTK